MYMKIWKSIFFLSILSFCLACEEMPSGNSDNGGDDGGVGSVRVESSTATTAVFSVTLDLPSSVGKSFEAGILYSTSENFTVNMAKKAKVETPKEGANTVSVSGLKFGTRYYFSAYVFEKGEFTYISEVDSFTTDDVAVEINAEGITAYSATLAGSVGISEEDSDLIRFGLLLSSVSGNPAPDDFIFIDIVDGEFSEEFTDLEMATVYYYTYCISQGTKVVVGETGRFSTLDPYDMAFSEGTLAEAEDLSSAASNSFIISRGGQYKFKAVKGNGTEKVEGVSSFKILWESFGTSVAPQPCDLISATYKDGDWLGFEVPSSFKEGNALLAAMDAEGKILWSWHIWLVADEIVQHEYSNGAGVMMDRNLGAVSAERGDAGALGLLYQWGRKDPFLGVSDVTAQQIAPAAATRVLPLVTVCSAQTGTVEWASSNPMTIILAPDADNSDWLYGASEDKNTRWSSDKTIYDPCPAGWRVPDGGPEGIWAKAGFPRGGDVPFAKEDIEAYGKTFAAEYCGQDAWYPAAGGISGFAPEFSNVGEDGIYWSVTPAGSQTVHGLSFFWHSGESGYVYPDGLVASLPRSSVNSVRCCREN